MLRDQMGVGWGTSPRKWWRYEEVRRNVEFYVDVALQSVLDQSTGKSGQPASPVHLMTMCLTDHLIKYAHDISPPPSRCGQGYMSYAYRLHRLMCLVDAFMSCMPANIYGARLMLIESIVAFLHEVYVVGESRTV